MYGIAIMFEDLEYGEGPHWRFPEDWERTYDSWAEAAAAVLRQAERDRAEGAELRVLHGHITPHEGCLDDDGATIPPGECGEPAERRFVVEVRDDVSRTRWAVT